MQDKKHPSSLRRSLRFVTVGGGFAMLYYPIINSALATYFFIAVGATDFHFGLLSGLPMIVVFLQFIGAMLVNVLDRRKPLWMFMIIASRLLYLPIVFCPLLFPGMDKNATMVTIISLVAISSVFGNIMTPVWMSWMADLVPQRVLNTYWGTRTRWLSIVTIAASVLVAGIAYLAKAAGIPITTLFPIIVTFAVLAGVLDIVMFLWVDEPPNIVVKGVSFMKAFAEPFAHPEYKTFLIYSCAWSASTMFAAAFMLPYAVRVLGLREDVTQLIWCVGNIGVALSASQWGKIADRHGQKPVLAFCTWFKPLVAIAFIVVTKGTAVWLLPIAFLLDGAWNAGNGVATNGFMMKIAPKENRAMYVAALIGLSSISGGVAAIVSGWVLEKYSWFEFHALGRTWTNYHIIFLMSVFMRIACAVSVQLVREPGSTSTVLALDELLNVWPMNLIRFPIDLYRKHIGVGKPR
jgi:MFS family permease